MMKSVHSLLLLILLVLTGCFDKTDKLNIKRKSDTATAKTKAGNSQVVSVEIVNDQLVINGSGFSPITKVQITGPAGFDEQFQIESNSGSKIISNGLKNILFALSGAFNLILSDAHGAATTQIGFTLQNGAVTGEKIARMGATNDQVLAFDGTKWSPKSLDGLTFKGTFDASSAADQTGGSANDGFYYIVQTLGTNDPDGGSTGNNFAVGDWAVKNGAAWNKVVASNAVSQINGETGNVNLGINHLTDVDTTSSAPTAGQVLKWNSGTSKWEPSNDATGGAAGSVVSATIQDGSILGSDVANGTIANANLASDIDATKITAGTLADARLSANVSKLGADIDSSEIANDSIVDADINSAAAIAQSKIANLTTDLAAKAPTPVSCTGTSKLQWNGTAFTCAPDVDTTIANTNAGTICSAGEYLDGDGTCKTANTSAGDFLADGSVPMSGNLDFGNNKARFKSDNANYVELIAPNSLAATYSLTLPADDGANGQVLQTDGAGVLSWQNASSGADHLGNHTATQALILGSNRINFDADPNEGISLTSTGRVRIDQTNDASGNEAIGLEINNPDTKITLGEYSSVNKIGFGRVDSNPATVYIGNTGGVTSTLNQISFYSNDFRLVTGSTTFLRVNPTGQTFTIGDKGGNQGREKLNIHEETSDAALLRFTNLTTTDSVGTGINIGLDANENFIIDHRDAKSLLFNTDEITRMTIDATGNVGIGVASPSSKLDVNGIVRATQICDETGANCRIFRSVGLEEMQLE